MAENSTGTHTPSGEYQGSHSERAHEIPSWQLAWGGAIAVPTPERSTENERTMTAQISVDTRDLVQNRFNELTRSENNGIVAVVEREEVSFSYRTLDIYNRTSLYEALKDRLPEGTTQEEFTAAAGLICLRGETKEDNRYFLVSPEGRVRADDERQQTFDGVQVDQEMRGPRNDQRTGLVRFSFSPQEAEANYVVSTNNAEVEGAVPIEERLHQWYASQETPETPPQPPDESGEEPSAERESRRSRFGRRLGSFVGRFTRREADENQSGNGSDQSREHEVLHEDPFLDSVLHQYGGAEPTAENLDALRQFIYSQYDPRTGDNIEELATNALRALGWRDRVRAVTGGFGRPGSLYNDFYFEPANAPSEEEQVSRVEHQTSHAEIISQMIESTIREELGDAELTRTNLRASLDGLVQKHANVRMSLPRGENFPLSPILNQFLKELGVDTVLSASPELDVRFEYLYLLTPEGDDKLWTVLNRMHQHKQEGEPEVEPPLPQVASQLLYEPDLYRRKPEYSQEDKSRVINNGIRAFHFGVFQAANSIDYDSLNSAPIESSSMQVDSFNRWTDALLEHFDGADPEQRGLYAYVDRGAGEGEFPIVYIGGKFVYDRGPVAGEGRIMFKGGEGFTGQESLDSFLRLLETQGPYMLQELLSETLKEHGFSNPETEDKIGIDFLAAKNRKNLFFETPIYVGMA